MKRAKPGTYKTYDQAAKRQRKTPYKPRKVQRAGATVGEPKMFDCELAGTALSTVTTTWVAGTQKDPSTTINLGSAAVATPLCLFAPTVGAAFNQRIGRSVLVTKIRIRGEIYAGSQAAQNAVDSVAYTRLILVQDQQTNGAQMTGAQLMNDAGAAGTTINSFQNPNNFGRFRVLKDKIIALQNPNFTGTPGSNNIAQAALVRPFKMNISFREPIKVQFNAVNGGTVADVVDNSFHIFCACDDVTLIPSITYYSRVVYKE